MRWTADQLSFEFLSDATDDPVVTIEIRFPAGTLLIMGEPEEQGRTLILRGVHIHSEENGENSFGLVILRKIAKLAMERFDYDKIEIHGTRRTTGASPGRFPKPLRFTR